MKKPSSATSCKVFFNVCNLYLNFSYIREIVKPNLNNMENLIIESTNGTPAVLFLTEKGILKFAGKSLPEDAVGFYQKVEIALNDYIVNNECDLLHITCEFEYINTSSSKALFNILKKAIERVDNVSIVWGYEEEDEDMLEQGEDFADALGVEFEFKIFIC